MSSITELPSLADLLKEPQNFADHSDTHWRIFNAMTGDLVIEVPRTVLPIVEGGTRAMPYSPAIIDMMCAKIVEGTSLTKICETPGFPPYPLLCKWRRTEPWINEVLEQARQDRAEMLRDKALEMAMDSMDKNDAPAQALKVETLKWAAGIDSPKYSPKSKVDVNVTQPTQIVVVTGIDRAPRDVTPEEKK